MYYICGAGRYHVVHNYHCCWYLLVALF